MGKSYVKAMISSSFECRAALDAASVDKKSNKLWARGGECSEKHIRGVFWRRIREAPHSG